MNSRTQFKKAITIRDINKRSLYIFFSFSSLLLHCRVSVCGTIEIQATKDIPEQAEICWKRKF